VRALRACAAGEDGPEPSEALRAAQSSAAPTASVRLRIALGIGILGLMTVKPPDPATASLVVAAAAAAGLVAGRRARPVAPDRRGRRTSRADGVAAIVSVPEE
jgi:hypothetical protein